MNMLGLLSLELTRPSSTRHDKVKEIALAGPYVVLHDKPDWVVKLGLNLSSEPKRDGTTIFDSVRADHIPFHNKTTFL
jgi:hypothetical protein